MNYYDDENSAYEGPYEYSGEPYHSDERQFFPNMFNPFFPGSGSFPGGGHGGGHGGNQGYHPSPFPGGGGPGGGGQNAAPTSPPPSFVPQQQQDQFMTKAIDPGAIRGCMFRFTYVWLRRDSFWFYPTFIGRRSISGFRWNGFRWVMFGIDLNRIESFQCF